MLPVGDLYTLCKQNDLDTHWKNRVVTLHKLDLPVHKHAHFKITHWSLHIVWELHPGSAYSCLKGLYKSHAIVLP